MKLKFDIKIGISEIITILGLISTIVVFILSKIYYTPDIDITYYSISSASGYGNVFIIHNNTKNKQINNLVFKLDDEVIVFKDVVGDAHVVNDNNNFYYNNTFSIINFNPDDSIEISFLTDKKIHDEDLLIYSGNENVSYQVDINNKEKNKIFSSIRIYAVLFIISVLLTAFGIGYLMFKILSKKVQTKVVVTNKKQKEKKTKK